MKTLSGHRDHISIGLIKKIPDIINNPVIIAETKYGDTANFFGWEDVGTNSPIMVGVVVTKGRNGTNYIDKVRTFEARRNVNTLINDDNVLYINEDKKRTLKWFQAHSVNIPMRGTKFGFIRSLSRGVSDVKFSERDYDTITSKLETA